MLSPLLIKLNRSYAFSESDVFQRYPFIKKILCSSVGMLVKPMSLCQLVKKWLPYVHRTGAWHENIAMEVKVSKIMDDSCGDLIKQTQEDIHTDKIK